ncbi:hypothetical protein BDV93DRAFT_550417 [Ceratobasidium sp. AG-I]|nr:hypothetical protein BDV93DRAFT_550417 [Ceratobasidium sp. AG-I]
MVILKSSFVALATLLSTVYAAPTDLAVLDRRATVLAGGANVVVGTLPDWSLIFRASGYLAKGGCPASASITTCYVQKLSAKATENLDPDLSTNGPSQTNLVSTTSLDATGAVTKFTFKLFIDPALKTPGSSPVPIVQVVSKEPVDGQGAATKVFLDVRNNVAGIYAFSNAPVVSIPLSSFSGKTTLQTWTIKGGPQGYADIDIKDAKTNASILKYRVNQANTVDSYRLRIGPAPRLANSGSAYIAYFGDWTAKVL